MSNNKMFKISNSYMLLCGIDWRDRSLEINDVVDYRFLPVSKPVTTTIDIQISYFDGINYAFFAGEPIRHLPGSHEFSAERN